MRDGLAGGTLAFRDQEMTLKRNGAPERVWLDLDYSPMRDEAGTARGGAGRSWSRPPRGSGRSGSSTSEQARLRRAVRAGARPHGHARRAGARLHAGEHRLSAARRRARHARQAARARRCRRWWSRASSPLLDDVRRTGRPFVGRGVPIMLDARRPDAAPEERYRRFRLPADHRRRTARSPASSSRATTSPSSKRAESALRESEARFRLVAESAPVMLWMGDADGGCVYLNARSARSGAWRRRTSRPSTGAPRSIPTTREALRGPFAAAMRERTARSSSRCRLRRADGAYRRIQTNAQPRFGARRRVPRA